MNFQMTKIVIVLSFISLLTLSAHTQAQKDKNPTSSNRHAFEFVKLSERIWFLVNAFDEFKDSSMKQGQLIKELFFQLNQTNQELNTIKSQKEHEHNQMKNQLKQTINELKETKDHIKRTNDELNQQKQTIDKLKPPKDQEKKTEDDLHLIKSQLQLLNESRNCQCQLPSIEVPSCNPILVGSTRSEKNCTQFIPNDLMCLNGGSPVFQSKIKNDCNCVSRFRGNRCQLNCTFKAEAGVDLPGKQFDISVHPEPVVDRCLDKCSATLNCLSVLYNGGNTNCILKLENSTTTDKSHFTTTNKENVLYTINCI